MWPNPQFPVDLVTYTGEILNGKLHFLCSYQWKDWTDILDFLHGDIHYRKVATETAIFGCVWPGGLAGWSGGNGQVVHNES